MKKILSYLCLIIIAACNNAATDKTGTTDSSGAAKKEKGNTVMNSSAGCGNSILFHEGLTVESKTYNATGATTGTSTARVTKVFNEGNITVAELESTMTPKDGAPAKISKMAYKCDGEKLMIDLSTLLGEGKPGMKIEGDGFSFPRNIAEGQSFPDAHYSISMNQGGKNMTITSTMKERKVIGKESITIDAGTFTCYKISSIIEASSTIEDMDEKSKNIMDAMKSKMPKSSMVLWYAPDATVMKAEFFSGDKLVNGNAITSMKK